MRRASGEIIAWLNSDDWYAPGIFKDVAQALQEYPLIMGEAVKTDRDGNPKRTIQNEERSTLELLRYWVPDAWLAQPGVFFSRSLLDAVALAEGTWLDEGYHYAMDYELWLRMARRHPPKKFTKGICAYFRVYDESKTGGKNVEAARIESSRAFRRHSGSLSNRETAISFVIPTSEPTGQIQQTLDALHRQSLRDFEILVIADSNTAQRSHELSSLKKTLETGWEDVPIRLLKAPSQDLFANVNHGIAASRGELVSILHPGMLPEVDFALKIRNAFLHDVLGVLVPLGAAPELLQALLDGGSSPFTVAHTLRVPPISPCLVARKILLTDAQGLLETPLRALALRRLLLQTLATDWAVSITPDISVASLPTPSAEQNELTQVCQNFINAQVVVDVARRLNSPFAQARIARDMLPLKLPPQLLQQTEATLQLAPAHWYAIDLSQGSELERITTTHPRFSPAWYFLAKLRHAAGHHAEAQQLLQEFQRVHV
ncbi:MAG: glycosyltransferase [Proteobacteria bacterium]|nr:glycosyltransferase [Pseudomonadota bacterium]